VRVFGIVGRQNSGKTHLIEHLVQHCNALGLRVSTVKHTHHHAPELEPPHKDSARHRAAGAQEVLLAWEQGWLLSRAGHGATPPLPDLLGQLAPCDLVLVEGYKQVAGLPRLEVYRGGEPPLALQDPTLLGVACPVTQALPGLRVPRLDLADTAGIAAVVLAAAVPPDRT
jgi:molybdopterin-guanine dinucleotide biosynthesis protein MobB